MELAQNTIDAKNQFNILFNNMFAFEDDDMGQYDACYSNVFSNGVNMSYMSLVFYAQFSAEILVGLLASNPFRKFLVESIENEKNRSEADMQYWHESMNQKRFGIEGYDYTQDAAELMAMANESYVKVAALNDWFGTEEGKEEFEMYCLSKKAVRDIKTIVCNYPYLIRKYDYDMEFANEIMEYAGIVANQILNSTN